MSKRTVVGNAGFLKACDFLRTLPQPVVGTNRQLAELVNKSVGVSISPNSITHCLAACNIQRKDPRQPNFRASDRVIRLSTIVKDLIGVLKSQYGLQAPELITRLDALINRDAE